MQAPFIVIIIIIIIIIHFIQTQHYSTYNITTGEKQTSKMFFKYVKNKKSYSINSL